MERKASEFKFLSTKQWKDTAIFLAEKPHVVTVKFLSFNSTSEFPFFPRVRNFTYDLQHTDGEQTI